MPKCDLASCSEPVEYVAVIMDKGTFKFELGFYCDYDYPEAWDLLGIGCAVCVLRISDFKIMKIRGRKDHKGHRYGRK